MVSKLTTAVGAFMRDKIGRPPRAAPGWPTDQVLLQRMGHLAEELGEIATAINMRDLPALADGLGDLVWIAQGLALDAGIPLDKVLEEIAKSNASKAALDPVSGKGGKGGGFKPPAIVETLMAVGWPGPPLPLGAPE